MGIGTDRRLWLGLGGALLALAVTVLIQSVLVQANYTAIVAESYAIVVGFAVAMPALQSIARPVVDASVTARAGLAVATALGSLVVGFAVVASLFSINIASSVTVAGGAAGAYVGGTAVHSYLVSDAEDGDGDSTNDGTSDPDSPSELDPE